MISVVIPTLNAGETLAATLSALVPAAVEGLVREVVVVDGGSSDRTLDIADHCGAEIVRTTAGRGQQLMAGAARARFPWLLFLHADTVPGHGWEHELRALIEAVEEGRQESVAAAFRFALDDRGLAPRALEVLVRLRCAALKLPYGDQGLFVSRRLYDEVGGYRAMPLMEDLDLIRRLGRRRVLMLRTVALTSASRFRREGYLRRIARNQVCLALFLLRAPMPRIVRFYGASPPGSRPVPLVRSRPAE